ncbi:hypothetical protein [Pedobacter alluvionis]|uniref:Uncharacterized protein n=1 Tax=Pedobacter alluvionis TaxID=475253 RepID=A0A497Y8L1_9SPHI|nr:hypothetical protein [Pedobacter alluvionis]RLJ79932.1 hypothetical protein BCL90_0657 [Pedobacter alluvionis]TFB31238.1 hypothetical protein E3V97_11565 [Pedobacter alluvionis]
MKNQPRLPTFQRQNNNQLQTENCKRLIDMGVTQGAGFAGLRFAPVPMKDRYGTLTIPNAKPTDLK